MTRSILAWAVAVLIAERAVLAQGDLSSANNVTSLEGTWSSNSAVETGGDFCIPAEMKFTYPNNTGISYSFTDTGFFEEAQYRYNGNASNPNCIQAVIFWQHGTYKLNNDGSMTLYPFASDGRIQVQDPCAAVTNIITYYDQITQYADWGITIDTTTANYVLRLNRFDGAKMPPMYLTARPPNMLPTQTLTGVNASGQTNTRKRSVMSIDTFTSVFKRSAASPRMALSKEMGVLGGVAGLLGSVIGLGLGML